MQDVTKIKEAEERKNGAKNQKLWIKKVRDVSYDIFSCISLL